MKEVRVVHTVCRCVNPAIRRQNKVVKFSLGELITNYYDIIVPIEYCSAVFWFVGALNNF